MPGRKENHANGKYAARNEANRKIKGAGSFVAWLKVALHSVVAPNKGRQTIKTNLGKTASKQEAKVHNKKTKHTNWRNEG